ncbi:unnamed protein product [Phytophthora lilii]|uniref:Unnamed protein product n=1 Tax=Phytophthora lilii TaxID=2077276 RepID=A0A9W6TYR9_9STRA|nr:unnamed protein product [Phytophthora lilii]
MNEPLGEWVIVHTGNGSALHNHRPSADIRVHAAHRSRSAQMTRTDVENSLQSTIEAQSAAGIPVVNIYTAMLNENPGSLILPKGISNWKNAAHRTE